MAVYFGKLTIKNLKSVSLDLWLYGRKSVKMLAFMAVNLVVLTLIKYKFKAGD
jgi:hypothetical protein